MLPSLHVPEALWQPARKVKTNENLRPVYVFSTHLANSAAEAVLKGRYDSIVQFHNAQPKGPGFIRLPQAKDSVGKKEPMSASKTSESEKEGSMRAPKRRSSRLSATEDTPASKKLRSGNKAKSPVPDDTKQTPTRYSRRIRQQQASSVSSPPSSPMSDRSSGAGSPPSSSKGRSGQRAGRAGGRRSAGRASPAINSSRRREEESEEEEEEEGKEEEPTHRDKEEEEENGREDQGDRDLVSRRLGEAVDGQDSSPLDSVQDGSKPQATQRALQDEDNYTICHGTPRSKGSGAVDMSSPASRGSQPPSISKPPDVTSPPGAHPSHQPSHPDAARLAMGEHQKHIPPGGAGGSLARDPMIGQHMHHEFHKDANNWPAGLGHQFSHVHGGYYGPGLHPMHYPPHQHVAHANYPYGVPYPWGPHAVSQHPRVPEATQHQYSHTDSLLHGRSEASQSGPSTHSPGHAPTPHMPYPHYLPSSHPVHIPSSSSAESGKDPATLTSEGHESTSAAMMKPASHEKHPLSAQQPHHAHPHSALRQLPSPGSAHPALPQVHHAFPRPPHALTPEHISGSSAAHHPSAAAAAFPYGLDPNNPAALHMHQLWQHTQMQQHPMRPIAPHLPPHLQPSPGMWYPHPLMQGGIAEDPSKRRAAASPGSVSKSMQQVDGAALRMNTNRNNSNSAGDVSSAQEAAHRTFSFLPKNTPGQFSVEYLTSSQERNDPSSHVHAHASHLRSYPGMAAVANESLPRAYITMHHEAPHLQSIPVSAGTPHTHGGGILLTDQDYAPMSQAIQRTRPNASAQDNIHLTSSFPR